MAHEIKMPQLSDTMNSGKIIAWKKNEGDEVKRGDILAEVETEKANLEIESFQQGVLLKILVPGDTAAKVGDVIAVIGARGEKYESKTAAAESSKTAAATPSKPVASPVAAPAPKQSAPTPAPVKQSAPVQVTANNYASDERIKASPLARKMALERNIDLSAVSGSGPEGRIVRKDIDNAQHGAPQLSVVHSSSNALPAPRVETPIGSGKTYPLSKMRDLIARRMQESVTQSPHFYTTTSIEMSEAKRLYGILKERPEFKGISLNHFVIKAAAYGIATEPRVNFAMREGQVYEPASINIGIITALDDGLLIPVIKEANTLSFKDLVFESRAAIERARAGRPSSADLTGGTFSISNMGMFDVENFTAIINPGQGAVLAVSSAIQQPVVKNGEIAVGLVMKATISVDHRIIDGVMAANFLKAFKQALETPALLML